ncbi:HAD-IA family hydrolase [Lachnospiraceae bacterium NSJ-143]|mgnify:CR=1 FL=1|nr:HAD-IA family hydrolase [Lachnospiraceae bacterium NSJ-143]
MLNSHKRTERVVILDSSKYKAVLFDLDGTLINSIYDLYTSVNHVLAGHGFKNKSLEEVNMFVGNGLRRLMELSLPDKTENFDEIYNEFRSYYFSHCCEKTIPYKGIAETLAVLKQNGFKLAVVTNKPDSAAKEICGQFFEGIFDTVAGEREGVPRKPAPDIAERVIRILGASKRETLYVGDSEVDILTGKNAGIDVLSVSYGFRSAEMLKNAGACEIVDNPVDICRFLVNFGG